ncbi:hypothetical protein, partial [Streptomyces sp. SM13]|uniref:BP74-related protein n=1 Tax=Streptomyces sp. SM13 TaxID=1983803 RepID=UPI000CD54AAF
MAIARFAFQCGTGKEFIFELTDDKKIEHARQLLAKKTTEEPHVGGRIKKRQQPYNPDFEFHLDPETIAFFEYALSESDAVPERVAERLDDIGTLDFLPGYIWQPWAS